MTTDSKPVAIEISEEAYKQNTVYRPWSDIQAGTRAAKSCPPAARAPAPKNLLGSRAQ